MVVRNQEVNLFPVSILSIHSGPEKSGNADLKDIYAFGSRLTKVGFIDSIDFLHK